MMQYFEQSLYNAKSGITINELMNDYKNNYS